MKNRIRISLALLFALILPLLLPACKDSAESDKPQVVATLFPQYDFARNIAGDRAAVTLLLDFGADAHTYDPTPADMLKIANSDLFIYTGGEMELWAEKLLKSADIAKAVDSGKLRVLDLSRCVTLLPAADHDHDDEHDHGEEHDHDHDYDHDHGTSDAHIWTSFGNAKAICAAIADALSEVDKDGASLYSDNLTSYTTKLEALKTQMHEARQQAAHDCAYFGGSFAFAYLFDEFDIEHLSVFEGCASHTEASPAAMLALVKAIGTDGARVVLYDSLAERKTAEAVAAETGAKVLHLHAIHNISKDEYDSGENFLSLMKKNIEVLKEALN